jgi:predicted ATPase
MNIKYISEVSAQRYKNLDLDQGLKLSEGLNIFIGSNGSGKSNFIALLKLLKDSVSDNISSEKNGVTSFIKAMTELGESRILNAAFSTPEKVNLTFTFFDQSSNDIDIELSLSLSILCLDKKFPQIVEENLSEFSERLDRLFYYYRFPLQSSGYGAIFDPEERSRYTVVTGIPTDEIGLSIIPKLLESIERVLETKPLFNIRRQIINLVSDWRFYSANNMNLKEIRNAEPEIGSPEKYLNPNCENLALVLDNLIQESIDFEDQLNVIMRDIVPQTKRIRPIRTGRTRISIEWHLQNTKRPLYLDEMSDGTVRMLCWAIILNSPNLPSLIVIDEPEVGLHVQWLSYLAEWIKNAAARTQVIITTHSPDLLDKFTDRLENVHVFEASNPEQTLFHVKTLSRERLQDRLDEGWELGDLYRVGEPEIGGWAL